MIADNPDLVTVVGLGAGGWSDLGRTAREALTSAQVVLGSPRQLALLPAEVSSAATAAGEDAPRESTSTRRPGLR